MATKADVENLAMSRTSKSVCIPPNRKVCVNCAWYEQYFHKNRGNIVMWVPTMSGFCLLRDTEKDATEKCTSFESLEEKEGKK